MSLKACVNVWFYIIDRRKSVVYNIVTGFNKQMGKVKELWQRSSFLQKKVMRKE